MVINHIDFPIYTIIMLSSILLGALYVFVSLKNKKALDKSIILYFVLYFVFAILIAKLYTFAFYFNEVSFAKAGLASYGGLIGTIIAAIVYEKIYPKDGLVIKYTIISLPLVYAFGKIACFFNGCCFGIPYDGIFSVTYTDKLNEPVFPIQLLEVFIFIALFEIANLKQNKKNINYIVLIIIAMLKFFIEFLKYSPTNEVLKPNQIFSIILIFITTIIYLYKNKKANQN